MRGSLGKDPYLKFLDLLRKARKEARLTQAEASQRLGKPQSFLSKCESGERRVDVIELAEFARLYGKPLDYFIPGQLKGQRKRTQP